ncbi:hypothetical protein KM043_013353 [Ampulex compressa]|nr:hypothetical protein KM043_013353 [Ampulex compressa]
MPSHIRIQKCPVRTELHFDRSERTGSYYEVPTEAGPGSKPERKLPEGLGTEGKDIILEPLEQNGLAFKESFQTGDESLFWRRGRVYDRPEPSKDTPWRKPKSRDTSLDKIRVFEKQIKPWTEEEIVLNKTPRIIRDISKEKLDGIELKPTKLEKKEIKRSSFETAELNSITKKMGKDTTIDEKISRVDKTSETYVKEEDSCFLKGEYNVDESTTKRREGAKPWTEETITLKKSKPNKKEISKETIEAVELKPSKVIKKDIRKSSLEPVTLKPVTTERRKDIHTMEDDTTILKVTSDELLVTQVDKGIKKEDEISLKETEPKPWTEEKISLRSTKVEQKEIRRKSIEQVTLRPVKQEKKMMLQETAETADLRTIKDKSMKDTEEQQITRLKLDKDTEEETVEKTVSWRKGAKNLKEKIPYEEKEDKTILYVDKDIKSTEKQVQKVVSVPWARGKKKPDDKLLSHDEEDTTILKVDKTEETTERIKTKEAILWPRRRESKEGVHELIPSEEKPEEKSQEEKTTKVPWLREKKIPQKLITKEEEHAEDIKSVTLKPVKRQRWPEEREQQEKVTLKPVLKIEVEEKPVEEAKLKPFDVTKSVTVPQEEIVKEKSDLPWRRDKKKLGQSIIEEDKVPTVEHTEVAEVGWRKSRKKKEIIETPQQSEIKDEKLITLKPVKRKQQHEDKEKLEEVVLRPIQELEKSQEPKLDVVTLKSVKRSPKEDEQKEEVTLKPVERKKPVEEKPTEVKLKPVKRFEKPEEPKPEEVTLKPVKHLPKAEQEKEEITLKPVERKKPEEEKPAEVKLKPVRRLEKPEEPKPEEVTLKPVKKLPKAEQEKEEVTLKPVERKKPEEEKPAEVKLKPVRRLEKPEEPKPEEVTLKPVKKLPKAEQEKEEVTLKPVEKKKPEEEKPAEVKLKPVRRLEKPEEPKPEEVTLKPVKKLPKVEQEKEEVTLKPVERKKPEEEKPAEVKLKPVKKLEKPEEPKPEEVKLKPVKRLEKPEEPKPEEVTLKPVKHLPKAEQEKEEVTLKPVERKKPEKEKSAEVKLKPVRRLEKPEEPKPEEVTLKPVKKLPKAEQEKEEVTLKPVERKKSEEEKPAEVKLKPVKKLEKPEEPKPEEVILKPVKKLPKAEQEKEEVTLKPVERKKPEEEKPAEVKLKPVRILEKPEEPKPEEVTLKPVKHLPKAEQEKEEVTLKPVERKKPEEEKPAEVKLKPVRRLEKPEEPKPEEVTLKPVKHLPKAEQEKEEVTLKQVERKKPEEEKPAEVKLKPVKKLEKPEEPKPEEVTLKPVKKLPKAEQEKEEVTLKPVERKEPEEEKPAEVKLKPVKKLEKPEEPKPEEVTLKPVKHLPKAEQEKEEVILKPVERKKPEEEKQAEVKLKPVKRLEKPEEPKPEEVTLKPVKHLPKAEQEKEEVTLKPVERKKPEEEKPAEVKLKPVKKLEKPEEPKPEEVTLKPVKHLPKVEQEKEEVTLKPVERKKPEEEKPAEVKLKPVKRLEKPEEPKPEEEEPSKVQLKPVTKTEKREELKFEEVTLKPVMPIEQSNIDLEEKVELLPKPVPKKREEDSKEESPLKKVDLPWRRDKKTKKIVDFREEVMVVPIDQEERISKVQDKTETVVTTIEKVKPKTTINLEEEERIEVMKHSWQRTKLPIEKRVVEEMKPKEICREEVVSEETIETSKVIDEKVEDTTSWHQIKSRKPKEEKPEDIVLTLAKKEKPNEETLRTEKMPKPIPVKLEESLKETEEAERIIAELPERKPQKKEQLIPVLAKDKEKGLEETITSTEDVQLIRKQKTVKIDEKDFQVDEKVEEIIQADVTKDEERTRKRKQRTRVDISITDKEKKIAPRFIQKLQPVIAEPETTARFTCTIFGNPFPEITWYKNEQELHTCEKYIMTVLDTTATLEVTKVQKEDAGMYSCRTSNPAGVATSTVNLVIFEKEEEGVAPHFPTPVRPVIIEEHKPATLECIVTGTPVPDVKWYRGQDEIQPKKGIEMSFNPETGRAKMTILEPMPEDETIYRVRAVNKFGRAECRANLVISNVLKVSKPELMAAPRITRPLPAIMAERGKPLTLSADFESKPEPKVKWYRNGIEIAPTDNQVIRIFENTAELILSEVTKKDSGKYEIRVQNLAGEARSSGSVTVKEREDKKDEVKAPRFIEPLQPQTVTEGEVVIMQARVESYPIASFQWFHESQLLESTAQTRIVTQENRSILMVKEVKPEFAGTYTCRAENVGGSVTCTATVNIQDTTWEETVELLSPTFVKRLSPVKVMDGESVNLTCVVRGKPTPRVEWYHDSKPIKEGKEITIVQDNEGVCSLAITEVFPEDAGEYTCRAFNSIGEAACTSSLVVEAYEYVPDSEIASSIIATSLTTGQSGSEEDLLSPKETPLFDTDTEESAPEIIKKLPQLIPTKDGELTRLEVKVKGKPKPEGKWYKQGVEIVPSQEFQIEEFDDGTSVLTITEAYPDDTGEIVFEAYNPLGVSTTTTYFSVEGILGTKEYRKPEWVTHMEEMQDALKGKNHTSSPDEIYCMLSEAECDFPNDSLDGHVSRQDDFQRDSSTMINDFLSTKTLINIDEKSRKKFDGSKIKQGGYVLPKRYSDPIQVETIIGVRKYAWQFGSSSKRESLAWERKHRKDEQNTKETSVKRCKKVDCDKIDKVNVINSENNLDEQFDSHEILNIKLVSPSSSHEKNRIVIQNIPDKMSNEQKTNLYVSKLNIEKESLHYNLKESSNALESDSNVNAQSPSSNAVKRTVYAELPGTYNQTPAECTFKSGSLSRTHRERSKCSAKKQATEIKSRKESYIHKEAVDNKVIESRTKQSTVFMSYMQHKNLSEIQLNRARKKIVLDFGEFPPPTSEKQAHVCTEVTNIPNSVFYLSPIEENSEASSTSCQRKTGIKSYKTMCDPQHYPRNIGRSEAMSEFDNVRKYHTYPKSRIPVPRWSKERHFRNYMMDPPIYPLEPREIDLEAFQQLHTADSQEELQEFLLLESQCSGNLGFGSATSTTEMYFSEHQSEDERGTMSDY